MKLFPMLFCGVIFCATYYANQNSELSKSIARGKEMYNETCITCHKSKGEGQKDLFPPLANADYLLKTPNKAIASIKFGLKGKIVVNGVTYDGIMPSANLANDEIADIMNYILNSWGNVSKQPMITEKMVEAVKK